MRGGQEDKKPTKMVRSSIACSRCRRSKVKCVNSGVNSTCKACAQSNRDCEYPTPGSIPTPKRSDATAGIKQEEGESKKRIRKTEDTGRRGSERSGEDVLEDRVLTKKVWDDVYTIFKLHFSTEMPFLHPTSFKDRMRAAAFPKDPTAPVADNHDGNILLLGVLTLTARFQPDLIERHSDPTSASEYYAKALAAAFGPTSNSMTQPSLERIQALLMLALYEWGQTRGLTAWVYVGIAIKLAQSMIMQYEDDRSFHVLKGSDSNDSLKSHSAKQSEADTRAAMKKQETRRRTWWSCFIMDRMLSAGRFRPTMIDIEKSRIQLPRTDDDFLFGRPVTTSFLTDEIKIVDGNQTDDNILSWYIRLIEIHGRFSEWSYAGGRRKEKMPPWDSSTGFYKLRKELESFNRALPSNLSFTDENLSAHIARGNATAYASTHTLHMSMLILLHREYIPFIPLRSEKPSGPLDDPKFPPDQYEIPTGFWEESIEIMYRAARDIIRIVKTCQQDGALPESPQIGFAIWQATFVCIYGNHFHHMDPKQLVKNVDQSASFWNGSYTGTTYKLLSDLTPKLKFLKKYQNTAKLMHKRYEQVQFQFKEYISKGKPLPWSGGGLSNYLSHEKALKEFGSLSDTERPNSDGSEAADVRSRASTNEINGDSMQGVEQASAPRSNGAASWAPINGAPTNATSPPPPIGAEDRAVHPYPYGGPGSVPIGAHPYQQAPSNNPSQASQASPSNADSSGLNSPYTVVQQQQQQQQYQHQHPNQPMQTGYHAPMVQTLQPMGPPMTGPPQAEVSPHTWYQNQEGISMNGLDDFSQNGFAQFQFEDNPYESVNFFQVLNGQAVGYN